MGNCTKPQASEPAKSSQQPKQIESGAGKDRITDNDKAIIDIKGRMRKLKTYEAKLAQ